MSEIEKERRSERRMWKLHKPDNFRILFWKKVLCKNRKYKNYAPAQIQSVSQPNYGFVWFVSFQFGSVQFSATCISFNRCMRLSCGNSLNTHTLTLITHVCVIYLFFPTVWLCVCNVCLDCAYLCRISHFLVLWLPLFFYIYPRLRGFMCIVCAYLFFSINTSNSRFESHATFRAATLKIEFGSVETALSGVVACIAMQYIALHLLSHRISN